jgi:hypothetical protein
MGLLARALKPRGPTHGRLPCSSLVSPGDVVPMVPNPVMQANPKFVMGQQMLIVSELHKACQYCIDLHNYYI